MTANQSNPTPEQRLDAMVRQLKELDAKATPAPWITQEEDEHGKEMSLMGPMDSEDFDQLTLNYTMSGANAKLLCFLRNSVPHILDLLARLDAAEAPCVWSHIGGEFQQGCDKVMWLFFAPKFCPSCGHPVQVKQEEEK